MNLVEPIDIRTGKPFDSRRQHLHHPSIHGASIDGNRLVTGRARGLMGGAFMGVILAMQDGEEMKTIKLPSDINTIQDLRDSITASIVPKNSWCFRKSPTDGTSTLFAFVVRGNATYYIVNCFSMDATTGVFSGNGSGGGTATMKAKKDDEYYVYTYPEA